MRKDGLCNLLSDLSNSGAYKKLCNDILTTITQKTSGQGGSYIKVVDENKQNFSDSNSNSISNVITGNLGNIGSIGSISLNQSNQSNQFNQSFKNTQNNIPKLYPNNSNTQNTYIQPSIHQNPKTTQPYIYQSDSKINNFSNTNSLDNQNYPHNNKSILSEFTSPNQLTYQSQSQNFNQSQNQFSNAKQNTNQNSNLNTTINKANITKISNTMKQTSGKMFSNTHSQLLYGERSNNNSLVSEVSTSNENQKYLSFKPNFPFISLIKEDEQFIFDLNINLRYKQDPMQVLKALISIYHHVLDDYPIEYFLQNSDLFKVKT